MKIKTQLQGGARAAIFGTMAAALALMVHMSPAKSADLSVPVNGTIATAITAVVDPVDNGLWSSGNTGTNWSMSADTGVITVNSGNYAPLGNGTPGVLTISGTPGAPVSIVQTTGPQRTANNWFDISVLTCSTPAVTETACNGAGITDAFDAGGNLVVNVGVGTGEWAPAGGGSAPAGVYSVGHTIAVNYL